MTFKELRGYWQLVRPVNIVMVMVAMPAAYVLAGGSPERYGMLFLAVLTGILLAAGANAINDCFDIEIDRINKPQRPLPGGILTPRQAKNVWLAATCTAIFLNIFISLEAFGIVVLAAVFIYVYSARFKKTVLLGNIVVGIIIGSVVFMYSGVVAGHIRRAVLPALFACLSNIIREIVKDIEDYEGDKAKNAATLPVRYGLLPARLAATVAILLLICATIAAMMMQAYSLYFSYCVIPLDIAFVGVLGALWQASSTRAMHALSTVIKICMVGGLLGIILGSMPL